jgi:hypothetical protein
VHQVGFITCRKEILLFSKTSIPDLGPNLLFNGYRGSLPEVKRPVCEELHLVPRLRMSGAVPTLPLCFHGVERGKVTVIKLYNDQRNAQVFNLFIYLLLHYMLRAFF